jgi:hypothetical protein
MALDYFGKTAQDMRPEALTPADLVRLRERARALLSSVPVSDLASAKETATASHTVNIESGQASAVGHEPAAGAGGRRLNERRKTLLSAKLVLGDMSSVIDCFVRDLSDSGARVALAAPVQLPQVFVLRFNNGTYHRCRVMRRKGLEIGVQFLD